MLEQGEQRHRRKPAERDIGREPGKYAGRRVGERIAAEIVDRHIPARQRCKHAAGERTVGRDKRRGHARRFQGFAQCDRNGERFFLRIRRLDHADRGSAA